MAKVSKFDEEMGLAGRDHINRFLRRIGRSLSARSGRLLEIAPQGRSVIAESFGSFVRETLDMVATHHPTYVGDVTKCNATILDDTYDCITCMEVLEHTLDPFAAIREMRRMLKHEGLLLLSAPLNWRIHGPIPDCWRFTEHGFKVLLRDFDIIEIDILETPERDLFPIHYNVLARNNKFKNTADADLKFRFID